MKQHAAQQLWEALTTLLETLNPEQIEAFLETLPSGETAWVLSRLSQEQQRRIFTALRPEEAAELVEQIPEVQAVDVLEHLRPATAAAILQALPSDEQADLLGDLDPEDAEAILAAMDPEEAHDARVLSQYADDVAGGLMVTEFLAYRSSWSVAEVIADLRVHAEAYSRYDVQYAYVEDAAGKLVGVLRLRDLLLARPQQTIGTLMLREPLTVSVTATLDDLRALFDRYHFFGIPVVDTAQTLVGVVHRAAVEEAVADHSDRDYRHSQGIIGGEELRTMPLLLRSRRRLAWLSVNILLNVLAASVIALYQDTLTAVIALAVFLPIISDMSGCAGNQAVAVSIRELVLGLLKPTEMPRVWLKEVAVGAVNGLVLGLILAVVAWFWQGNPFLGVVVGVAMTLNTMVAVSIGGLIPLLLRRCKLDPALASGPMLTTITDMCGFFLLLSMATLLLPYLVRH